MKKAAIFQRAQRWQIAADISSDILSQVGRALCRVFNSCQNEQCRRNVNTNLKLTERTVDFVLRELAGPEDCSFDRVLEKVSVPFSLGNCRLF